MVTHLGTWNAWSDFYRLPLVALTMYVGLQRSYGATIRIIAAAALVQQGMLLFYNADGRYSFLAWMLCLLVSAACFREELLPALQRWHRQRRQGSVGVHSLESR